LEQTVRLAYSLLLVVVVEGKCDGSNQGNQRDVEEEAFAVPRKIRALVKDLEDAGFEMVSGAGKGSHRKFTHPKYPGAVTLSGQEGDDAKPYQEKQVKRAIEEVQE
jgi:predicted RNA binding protein YcfA (HicA-like mRNA interferase family)